MARRHRLLVTLRICAAALGLILVAGVVDSPIVTVYRIAGNSMRPTYQDGDRVLVANFPLLSGGIGLGDAVIAEAGGETLIKRVIGLPGDSIEFDRGICWRNGLREDVALCEGFADDYCHRRILLGSDEYFVAGDNRRISIDSRSFGPLHRDAIVGEVIYRFAGHRDVHAHESNALEPGAAAPEER